MILIHLAFGKASYSKKTRLPGSIDKDIGGIAWQTSNIKNTRRRICIFFLENIYAYLTQIYSLSCYSLMERLNSKMTNIGFFFFLGFFFVGGITYLCTFLRWIKPYTCKCRTWKNMCIVTTWFGYTIFLFECPTYHRRRDTILTLIFIFLGMHVCIFLCMYVCACAHGDVCAFVHGCMRAQVHAHIHMFTRMYVCVLICMRGLTTIMLRQLPLRRTCPIYVEQQQQQLAFYPK